MENGKGHLGKPRDKKGKGCHDLSKRLEAVPRSLLTLRSLVMIFPSVLSYFRNPTLSHQTSDLSKMVDC